jgi:hypothetical protein
MEKPISTIRKAVKEIAENHAKKDFFDKPEAKHYDSALLSLKLSRFMDNPNEYTNTILANAETYDMKKEMGEDLHDIFDKVLIEKTNEGMDKVKEKFKQQDVQENINLLSRYLKVKADEVKKDPRIVSVFTGKEELLQKGLDSFISRSVSLFSAQNEEHPMLSKIRESNEKMKEEQDENKKKNLVNTIINIFRKK